MTDNPLLNRIRIPGETFRLPSGGLFYGPGVLSEKVIDGEIYVYPMTAIDEIVFKTPDMLFSGKAIEEVFLRCVPDVLDVKKMLTKDVDFLMICLRRVSYGPDMEITYKHSCENAKDHQYRVSVQDFLLRTKRIDPTKRSTDFKLTLSNEQVVELAPITYGDFITLSQATDQDLNPEKIVQRLSFALSSIIKSVDNVSEKNLIQEWIQKLPPLLLKQLTDSVEKTTEWGVDFATTLKCTDCGEEVTVQTPFNPLAFFT